MKKYLQFICFFIICSNSYSQSWQNLVPNYSFEHHDLSNWNACLNCTNDPQSCGDWLHHYEYMEDYWSVVDNWTLPLQRKWCSSIFQPPVPTADLYHVSCNPFNNARSGETWGHTIDDGEYLIVKTKNRLKSNKLYFLEIFHNGGGQNNRVVAYKNQPVACKTNKKLIEYIANSNHNVLLEFDAGNSGWTRYRTYFSPSSNKDWLSFGRNGNWDDLRIYKVQPNKCRTDWYFDNTVFNYPTEVFQASHNIYIGKGVDPENGSNHIPGKVVQYPSSTVVLRAGNQIIIEPGTFIMGDATKIFKIAPEPCKEDLCPKKLHFENQILCSESSKVIGPAPNLWGTTVHWSPGKHLSNPNISNPTFTAPNGNGAIEYTVTVTYRCDASEGTKTETHHVVVQYTNNTDNSANISATNTQYDDYSFSTDLHFSSGVTQFTISVPSSPGYSKTFYKGIDYTCCDFHWELPNAWKWSSCKQDLINITAKNKCSGNTSAVQLTWDKTNTPFSGSTSLPNTVTPNGDGIDDQLCFHIPSADNYIIYIFNRDGYMVFSNSGIVTSSTLCFPPLNYVSDGTYSYMIYLFDNCGHQSLDYNFLHVFTDATNGLATHNGGENRNAQEFIDNDNSTSTNRKSETSPRSKRIILYPNPTNTSFQIVGVIGNYKIRISDGKGKNIPFKHDDKGKVDISHLAAGTYIVHIITKQKDVVKKLIVY